MIRLVSGFVYEEVFDGKEKRIQDQPVLQGNVDSVTLWSDPKLSSNDIIVVAKKIPF